MLESKQIPILPPYSLVNWGVKKSDMEAILPFFSGSEKVSNLRELVTTHMVTVITHWAWMEEELLKIIKQKYPNKMLLPSSYMMWHYEWKVVCLDVGNYWFVAFPWGKGDGGVLAELLDMRWSTISEQFWWEVELHAIIKKIRSLRPRFSRDRYVNLCHRRSIADLAENPLKNDELVKRMLWFDTDEVHALLEKKLPNLSDHQRLGMLLTYKHETFKQILEREYAEEAGRQIISSSLRLVLLEEKWPHLLKVRMYYEWEVTKEQEDLLNHTSIEKDANITHKKIKVEKLLPYMKKKLLGKLWYNTSYEGKEHYQQKKSSTAIGHYLAYKIYSLLTEENNARKKKKNK